jgi:hypothetical protein
MCCLRGARWLWRLPDSRGRRRCRCPDPLFAAVLEVGEERAERPAVGSAGIVVVAQGVLDAVAGLAAGTLDEGRWPTLGSRYYPSSHHY